MISYNIWLSNQKMKKPQTIEVEAFFGGHPVYIYIL